MGDTAKQYRIKPSYQKPAGGFLAIGPRYPGELVNDATVVRFVHPGLATWVEIVPIAHVEEVQDPPRYRGRLK